MNEALALAIFSHTEHNSAELAACRWESEAEFYLASRDVFPSSLLLQTCNRVEILVRGDAKTLSQFLRAENKTGFYILEGEDALTHLLELSAGTKSLIVGEDQILGQLKKALLLAEENKSSDSIISACITTAIRFGVSVRQKTQINRGAVSIGSAAVLLAEEELGCLVDKNILVVGGGEMGKLVAKSLAEKKLRAIYVTNRSYENAVSLAKEIDGMAMRLDQLYPCIALSDVVISCTAAPHEIIHAKNLAQIMEDRFWPLDPTPRKLIMIDIASPPDIEAECGELAGVSLYTIDDLKDISNRNMESRKSEMLSAKALVSDYVPEFVRIINRTAAGDMLSELYSWADEIRTREVEKALRLLKSGGDAREIIQAMSLSLTKKLLDDVGASVRRSAEECCIENAKTLVNAITTRKS